MVYQNHIKIKNATPLLKWRLEKSAVNFFFEFVHYSLPLSHKM
ncbi:hypothetical protein B4168_3395 [Anoxybacillus flavithermus]|nr:hypothetical protein B4168_3395 [Anoxybacillus flavithermus]OAO85033.1 hypothetical protein GT23_3087 [Parageobacillus thermoglucosidasius]